jgi:hypothetical protein
LRENVFVLTPKCLLLCSLALPLAGACSQPAIQQAAANLIAIQKTLLATPLGEEMDPSVPPVTRQSILKLKDSIAHLADAYMNCQPQDPDPQRITQDLTALIPPNPSDENKFGSGLTFQATTTGRLISITAQFGIKYGDDTMLLIFSRRENAWSEVLRWQAPLYKDVSGAFWSFQHKISPPDASGNWFVITSRVMPWCSSTWSSIEYTILRPGPKVLLKRSESMWWGGEDFGTLAATQNTADIRYHGSSIDPAVHNRLFIRHYEISGDSIKRVEPIAESPRDFVDEWIVSPWSEAPHWSAPGLESLHAQAKKNADEFTSIQKCSDQPDTVQIALTDYKTEETHFYFRVTGRAEFKMMKVRTTPDPNCNGPNLFVR